MEDKKCSFCGVNETEDNLLLSVNNNSICHSCAETAIYLMNVKTLIDTDLVDVSTDKNINKHKTTKYNTPRDYKNILDKYVIGQDEAKKVLSTAVYNHLQRIKNPELGITKSNILMIGPTGTGKTHLAETIAKNLDIPLAIVNTTSLTAAGYIGEDVSSVLERLWKDANEDVHKAERGIIFLDEIDKNKTSSGGTNNKDVSGKAVQQELLKLLEGDVVKIYPEGSNKNRKTGKAIEINTKDILFIAGGAFVDLKKTPGVTVNALGKVKNVQDELPDTDTLINYGMIPEFIGRFPMIVELNNIDLESMERILTEPDNSIIEQYINLFRLSNVNLEFTDKAIKEVAMIALTKKTGARGLRNVMENIMMNYMFNIDEYKNKQVQVDFKYNKFKIDIIEEELTA